MKSIGVKEIIKLSINEIYVNPENPRHEEVVIDLSEVFIMQQLVKTKKDSQAMYKLICDIYENSWFPQSIVTVTYNKEKEKYVAWDGNRRLTALKILQNPKLLENLNAFTYTQKNKIHEMHKGINDDSFYEVSCYIATSFEECADYIRAIHTTDTGALPWSDVAKKRFENKLGTKNLFSQLKEYCSEPFEKISEDFSVNKFEKIVKSKVGKEYLGIDNQNNILTHTSTIDELKEKLSRIVNDIETNKLKNDDIKNATEIKKYLFDSQKKVTDNQNENLSVINEANEVNKSKNDSKEKQISDDNKIQDINQQFSLISPYSYQVISKDNNIFANINIQKLNKNNIRAKGIQDLCYEIQQMSINKQINKYSISFAFLLRSLLEQSAIYFLINKNIWDSLKQGYNNKDLKLEQIIKEIDRRKSNFFDVNILRCWDTFNNNTSTKDYFDMIVHHPYLIRSNIQIINNISDNGLYAVIQFFINN